MGSRLNKIDEIDLGICEYFSGWTLDYVRNLTVTDKQIILEYINKKSKERNREFKRKHKR